MIRQNELRLDSACLRVEYEKVDHLVEFDGRWVRPHVAEEAFEDAFGVDVDVGLLIRQIFKERVDKVRQIFHEIALKKAAAFGKSCSWILFL